MLPSLPFMKFATVLLVMLVGISIATPCSEQPAAKSVPLVGWRASIDPKVLICMHYGKDQT